MTEQERIEKIISEACALIGPKAVWYFESHCPKCGSSCFGSSQGEDGTWTRRCSGENEMGCGRTWHESEDDKYRVFVLRTKGEQDPYVPKKRKPR